MGTSEAVVEAATQTPPAGLDAQPEPRERTAFSVQLEEFTGPFELLLSLIAKHKLEVTALALHQVTDDFVAHVRDQGEDWDLEETTEFLVIAAILLDLKAARLLPGDNEEDEEDLALLEARDLLFARLLQYRAFKIASVLFDERLHSYPRWTPRATGLDPGLAELMPEVQLVDPQRFAEVAEAALRPRVEPVVEIGHIHASPVNVREQADRVMELLTDAGSLSFRELVEECPDTAHVIARFLSLLELYRQRAVTFEQAGPLADLLIKWAAQSGDHVEVTDEFDEQDEEVEQS